MIQKIYLDKWGRYHTHIDLAYCYDTDEEDEEELEPEPDPPCHGFYVAVNKNTVCPSLPINVANKIYEEQLRVDREPPYTIELIDAWDDRVLSSCRREK